MVVCDICGKKMPDNVLGLHKAKKHSVQVKPEVVTSTSEPKKWYESWDAGEIGTCAQCHQEWPSRLMSFHLKLEHGL